MIILYRPVLIGSAEQAEALPVGTVALDHPTGNADRLPYVKATAARWASVWGVDDLGAIDAYGTAPNEAMVGDRALVPIGAEEEWGVEMSEGGVVTHVVRAISREHAERTLSHQEPGAARIVHRIGSTPWEEA